MNLNPKTDFHHRHNWTLDKVRCRPQRGLIFRELVEMLRIWDRAGFNPMGCHLLDILPKPHVSKDEKHGIYISSKSLYDNRGCVLAGL